MNNNVNKEAAKFEECVEVAEAIVINSYRRLTESQETQKLPPELLGAAFEAIHCIGASIYIQMSKTKGSWDEGYGLTPPAPTEAQTETAKLIEDVAGWPETLPCYMCNEPVSRRPSKYKTPYYYPCSSCKKDDKPVKSWPAWYRMEMYKKGGASDE
jgi:hypothetical protein